MTSNKRTALLLALAGVGFVLPTLSVSPAYADVVPVVTSAVAGDEPDYVIESTPVIADYNGVKLDLSQSWSTATVCAAVTTTDVRCYADRAAADADLASIPPAEGSTAGAAPAADAEGLVDEYAGLPQPATDLVVTDSPVTVAALECKPGWYCGGASVVGACPSGWFCLFDDVYGQGQRLQFRDLGDQNLSDWGFRDRTSSVNNMLNPGCWGDLIDFRTGQPDPYLVWRWGTGTEDLVKTSYPHGGNWNDRGDRVRIRGC